MDTLDKFDASRPLLKQDDAEIEIAKEWKQKGSWTLKIKRYKTWQLRAERSDNTIWVRGATW